MFLGDSPPVVLKGEEEWRGRSDSNEGRGEERALFTRLRGIERGEGRGCGVGVESCVFPLLLYNHRRRRLLSSLSLSLCHVPASFTSRGGGPFH